MSAPLVLSGAYRNLFKSFPPTASVAADSVMPLSFAYDGDPGTPFRFGSNPGDVYLQGDLDLLAGLGRFEGTWSGGTPPGFTETNELNGTVTEETTGANVQEGSKSARFSVLDVGDVARLEKDVTVVAGWWMALTLYAKNLSGSATLKVRIQNLFTEKYLTTGMAWSASAQDALSTTVTGSFTQKTITFQVENFLAHLLAETATLRVQIYTTVATAGVHEIAVDSIYLIAGLDFASLHGHNLAPSVALELRSSSDPVTPFSSNNTLEATITKARPSCFAKLGARVYKRWWRMRFNGANPSALGNVGLCEAVLGQARVLTQSQNYPLNTRLRMPQLRTETPAGREEVFRWGAEELIDATLRFSYKDLASYQEARDEIVRRSLMGAEMMILVPKDDDPEVCILGRVGNAIDAMEAFLNLRDAEIAVASMPLATII